MLTRNDLSQIKTAVQETIRPEIKALDMEIKILKKNMSTKEDMRTLETKLKGEMKGLETRLNGNMKNLETSLKDDMKTLETGLKGNLEIGLKGLEKRLIERIDDAQMEIIATVEKHKADKVKVDNLEKRVERLEDNAGLPPYSNQ